MDTDSMETSIHSDTTHQPPIASPSVVSQTPSFDQHVMDHFAQMETMLTTFLSPRQETTRTVFCNYLTSELENLEERDFQKRGCQSQQLTLFRSSRTTSAYVLLSYWQPQQPADAAREYILTIPETQMPKSQAIQPVQQSQVVPREHQQSRGPQTSYLVVDEQQTSTI